MGFWESELGTYMTNTRLALKYSSCLALEDYPGNLSLLKSNLSFPVLHSVSSHFSLLLALGRRGQTIYLVLMHCVQRHDPNCIYHPS